MKNIILALALIIAGCTTPELTNRPATSKIINRTAYGFTLVDRGESTYVPYSTSDNLPSEDFYVVRTIVLPADERIIIWTDDTLRTERRAFALRKYPTLYPMHIRQQNDTAYVLYGAKR